MISRWDRWMFAWAGSDRWLEQLKVFWASIIFLKFAGLGRLWRGSFHSVLRPPFSDITLYPFDTCQVAWPGLEWLPAPNFTVYCGLHLICVTLSVFYAGRIYRAVVGPMLATLMAYLILISQLNYSHHTWQLLSVFVILVATDLRPSIGRLNLPWRLLQLLMTMVYLGSAASKMHPAWLSGAVFQSYLEHGEISYGIGANLVSAVGPSSLAWGVILIELVLALGLWFKSNSRFFMALALMFHISINLSMDVTTFSLQACALWICFAGFHQRSENRSPREDDSASQDEGDYWKRFGATVLLAASVAVVFSYRTSHSKPRFYRSVGLETGLGSGAVALSNWLNGQPDGDLLDYPGTAELRIYQKGHLDFQQWQYGRSWRKALQLLKQNAKLEGLSVEQTAYLTLGFDYAACDPRTVETSEVGKTGLEIQGYRKTNAFFPLRMLSHELNPVQILVNEGCLKQGKLEREYFRYFQFKTLQYQLSRGGQAWSVQELQRGRLPGERQFSDTSIQELLVGMGDYFSRQVRQGDGLLEYSYRPSTAKASDKGLLMVRPSLASWALASLASAKITSRLSGGDFGADFHRNLKALLSKYYRSDELLGWLENNKLRDLGAVALMSVALRTCPDLSASERKVLTSFDAAVDQCWESNGRFRTSIAPAVEFEINQNFYPGEALLAWARRENFSDSLKTKFLKSFAYYRGYYRKHRLPAFVPWHTMAYCSYLKRFKNPEMQAFVFEMNDELVNQFQPANPSADLDGAFWRPSADPKLRQGVHASATGVYLDGLAEAFELARSCGDNVRSQRYAKSIVRGVEHLQALQYNQNNTKTYLPEVAQHIQGGLRTTPWNGWLRVDNEAHAVLALVKIARLRVQIEEALKNGKPSP